MTRISPNGQVAYENKTNTPTIHRQLLRTTPAAHAQIQPTFHRHYSRFSNPNAPGPSPIVVPIRNPTRWRKRVGSDRRVITAYHITLPDHSTIHLDITAIEVEEEEHDPKKNTMKKPLNTQTMQDIQGPNRTPNHPHPTHAPPTSEQTCQEKKCGFPRTRDNVSNTGRK